jgi:protoporphyrinogen oxidase
MGLAVAFRLGQAGHHADVYERDAQVGGLATWYDFGRFVWDKFYHVILPSDSSLIAFMRDLGLGAELRWRQTKTGFFVDERLYSVSNNVEFLRFPLLPLWSKLRLAAAIVYCSRIDDWRSLERVPVDEWLVRTCGRTTYEAFWRPLLLAKLGENYRRVSAVFIWSYIKRLFSARDRSAQKEQLGHVSGGYRRVFERLQQEIAGSGNIHVGAVVERIEAGGGRGIAVTVDGGVKRYDKVICTSPMDVLKRIASGLVRETKRGGIVEYLGVVCVVLVTKRAITPYYVLNIADGRVPFTGVIGMSNVVDPTETGGLHVTYLPKYVLSTDEFLRRSDAEIQAEFLEAVTLIFPEFDRADIDSVHVNRAFKVQPLQVLDYSEIVPSTSTAHPDFYVLNTSQFVNNTLNNNEVIRAVDDFIAAHAADFSMTAAGGNRDFLRA